jgi:hypothetical protein
MYSLLTGLFPFYYEQDESVMKVCEKCASKSDIYEINTDF